MGHHSWNLLDEPGLGMYSGAVLSPVNYDQPRIARQIEGLRRREGFETIFDPQLYFPDTQRRRLRGWRYFPADVETADFADEAWWDRVSESVAATCVTLGCSAACSPAVVARAFPDEYYVRLVYAGNRFSECLADGTVSPIQTGIASLVELSRPGRALEVATILSRTAAQRVYLVLVGETAPRREISDPEVLKGAMRLISALEQAGLSVLVGFASSDLLLWKAAGASSCATGKYFNLRRFTRSRFAEPEEGGGQLPYWFEESLLAFLRDSDLVRVMRHGPLSDASQRNPFGQTILQRIEAGNPWLGLGWRQYMYWFADAERRVAAGDVDVGSLLASAERRWLEMEDASILMADPRNDGGWLRAWRRALVEYSGH
jgi:hypothetical protein